MYHSLLVTSCSCLSWALCFLVNRDEMIGSSSPWLWRNQILHLGPFNKTEAWEYGGQTSLPGTKGSPGTPDCQWENQASPRQTGMVGRLPSWEEPPLRFLLGSSRLLGLSSLCRFNRQHEADLHCVPGLSPPSELSSPAPPGLRLSLRSPGEAQGREERTRGAA